MALLDLDSTGKKAIFIIYVSVWVAFGLLSDEAKRRSVPLHPSSAVVVQSCLKLIFATGMFRCHDGSLSTLVKSFRENMHCLLLYAFPAGMYALYDILYYVNIQKLGAAKYMVLVESRMVLLAFVHQLVFQKRLSRYQWISVALIMFGCIIRSSENVDFFGSSESSTSTDSALDYAMMLTQILASCCATIYTEFLLKKKAHIPTNLQNIFMYLNTIAFLFVVLSMQLTGVSLQEALDSQSLAALFSAEVFPLIFIMSFGGILTSYFIKILDSVRKVVANGIEIVILSVVASIVYHQPLTPALVLSVVLVVGGTFIYSTSEEGEALPSNKNQGEVLPSAEDRNPKSCTGTGTVHKVFDYCIHPTVPVRQCKSHSLLLLQQHDWKISSPRRLSPLVLLVLFCSLPLANNLIGLHRYGEIFQHGFSVNDSENNTVSCGGHYAGSCSECAPQGTSGKNVQYFCHGDCQWHKSIKECVQSDILVSDSDENSDMEDAVSCGNHAAASCSKCAPQGTAGKSVRYFCHGECQWHKVNKECVPARDKAAAGYFTINEVDVTYLHELLSLVTKHLESHEIPYWLTAGTLLGAMRNRPPGQSRWDDDLDIAIRISDYTRVEKILEKDERLVAHRKHWGGNGYGLASYQSDGSLSIHQFNLDVFPYALIRREGDTTHKWFPYNNKTNETFWEREFFEKDEINETVSCSFWDLELQCPKRSVEVLKRHFGNEVMSVARVYSHASSKHKSVQLNGEDINNHVAFLPALNKELTEKLLPNLNNLVSDRARSV